MGKGSGSLRIYTDDMRKGRPGAYTDDEGRRRARICSKNGLGFVTKMREELELALEVKEERRHVSYTYGEGKRTAGAYT